MRDMSNTSASQKQGFNDIIRYRKFFGSQTGATSLIPATEFYLFQNSVGQADKNISTQAVVTLKQPDVSLLGQNGTIPNAEAFIITHIGIDIHVANVQATNMFTNDLITNLDITPVSVVNPYPLFDAIRTHGTFELWRNSADLLEQGNIADYPSGIAMNGWSGMSNVVPAAAGFAPGAAYTQNAVSVLQNGAGWRPLAVWQELKALDQFYGKLKFARPIDLNATALCGYIDVLLRGWAAVDKRDTQFIQAIN